MAEPFPANPLFTLASRKIRESARQAYRKSDFGRLLGEFERAYKKPAAGPRELGRVVRALERSGPRGLLRELSRSDAGRLARDLERYARRGGLGRQLVEQVLDSLGSAGKLIKALSGVMTTHGRGSSRSRALESALELVKSFGFEVLPRPGTEKPGELQRNLAVAKRYLEAHGQPVPAPEPIERTVAQSFSGAAAGAGQPSNRKTVDVPLSTGITRRFPKNHPIVTGEMVPADSSNVYAYGYDVNSWNLYVRFRAESTSNPVQKTNSPGPLYQYSHVPPELFLRFLRAGSKGNWVWDNLRVRGTVSGHRYDYRLVGISGGYVPRKAVLMPDGEYFLGRTVRSDKGRGLSSSRPDVLVRPLISPGGTNGGPNRGKPKPPNRGGPNRGRP